MRRAKYGIVAFALFLLMTFLFLCGLLDSADHFLTDAVYTSYRAVDRRIFVIGIDSDSLDRYGPWGTWSRRQAADLINYLNEDEQTKPAVIGVDIMFSGNTTDLEDNALADAVRDGGNVVLASQAVFAKSLVYTENGTSWDYTSVQKYEEPYDALRSVGTYGLTNIFTDGDGMVRRSIYSIDYNGKQLQTFSAAIAEAYAQSRGESPPAAPPLDSTGQWHIAFAAKPGEFYGTGGKGTSWVRVMDGEIPRALFADAIVLVGPYATGMLDNFYTAADRSNPMFGVEVHANILQSLLEENYKRQVPGIFTVIITFVLSAVLFIVFRRGGVRPATFLAIGLCAAYFFAAAGLFRFGWILPLLYPMLTVAVGYLAMLITNSVGLTVEKARLYDEMHRLFMNSIRTIANAIDAKDPCTSGHCQRVAEYALMIGRGLGFKEADLADLEYSALLHDVGKIGVSDSVLKKDGPLTNEEYAEMKTHPRRGAQILGNIEEFSGRITDGAKYHHERFDGRGYCEGISGKDIPEFGRIIAVADAFDAMTQNRPYHRRMPQEAAVNELRRNSGTQFDPELVELFVSLLEQNPLPEENAPVPDELVLAVN